VKTILACAIALAVSGGAGVAPPPAPVLVELFTSEGCSSCPAADVLLARLVDAQPVAGARIIGLELHVDYWDRLGWKDPFSSAAFTRRQEQYSTIFGDDKVYTPQMVVNGRDQFTGSDEGLATASVRKAAAAPRMDVGVHADLRGDTVRIAVDGPAATGASEKIDVVIAIAEDGLASAVKRGENSGRTLTHSAVVRRLEPIGTLDRDTFAGEGQWKLAPGWNRANLRVVAFLQGQKTRQVYGSAVATIGSR
jgi:hypothetical protein